VQSNARRIASKGGAIHTDPVGKERAACIGADDTAGDPRPDTC
jgi:hypothetical protein